jgi:outer membrane protein insertion porin family
MKNKLNQFFVILFLFFSTQAMSNPIKEINLIGLNKYSEKNILEKIQFKAGQNYSSINGDEIIKSLFSTGFFSDIEIIKDSNSLNIVITENPIIKYVEFSTSSKTSFSKWLKNDQEFISDVQFKEYSNVLEFSPGKTFTEKKLNEFISFLETKYKDAGYYNVNLTSNYKIDIQNRIGIDIKVNQGEKATIESFDISGNSIYSSEELVKLFPIGEPDFIFLNYFTNKDQFFDSEFRKGLENLTEYYFSSGFLDFKIISVDTNLSENKEKIFIDIIIDEGIKYKLGQVSFEGELGNQTEENLNKTITMRTGDVFNRSLIMSDIQKITDIYSNQGYAFIDINPVTSDFLDSININFIISLNKKVYINRITISGNTRTQDAVIRREIGISEGGLFSNSELRKSINKLRRLGYFSDVQMTATEVAGMPDKIDLNFTVEETKTGAISFSLSHSNNYGISLGAGVQEKNIFGSGNTLNTDLKLSESFNRLSFYFENPNYNENAHSLSFGGFMSEINDDDIMSDSYEINTKGLNLGYGIPITEDTRLNSRFEFSKNTIKCGTSFAASGYELAQCKQKNNDEFKFTANWNENSLNNYLNPTDGRRNSATIGISIPPGDFRYYNFSANHTSYSPLNNNLTLKLAGNLDFAKGYSNKDLPFFKRYFGGGSGSVRGFGNKTLGPLYPNKTAKGGELSILGSANLIAPAFFFDDNENMRMSVFVDAGNIYEKSSNMKLGDIRMSTGIGFAYLSPIGAIGMYWSTPLLKKSGDTLENFGFTLGTGF